MQMKRYHKEKKQYLELDIVPESLDVTAFTTEKLVDFR